MAVKKEASAKRKSAAQRPGADSAGPPPAAPGGPPWTAANRAPAAPARAESVGGRDLLDALDIASLERRRLGQDLHDTLGQELTALRMLADDLREALQTDPPSAPDLATRLARGLQRSQENLRALMRGLLPTPVDADGLPAALNDLASQVREAAKVTCTFDARSVSVDDATATQLFLIAQEAVHNAVRHARPAHIRITLDDGQAVMLEVQDDGAGMAHASERGIGLQVMRNRAALIGATLTIDSCASGGTRVTCALPKRDATPGR